MDILSNLTYAPGSKKKDKRVGRGEGSGHGSQSTRGMNGDGSRSGHKTKPGFEGGQMPLIRRIPKRGFKSPFKLLYVPINLGVIQGLVDKSGINEITPEVLYSEGLIKHLADAYKILGGGELKATVNVVAHKVSSSAKNRVESLGGKLTIIED